MRARKFEIEQDIDKIDIHKVCGYFDNIKCKYICVLHDKDNTRPHYHIMVELVDARNFEDIAKQCGVDVQYIEKAKTKHYANMVAYCFHRTTNSRNKYQYDNDCVMACNFDFEALLTTAQDEVQDKTRVKDLITAYANHEITYKTLQSQLTFEEYNKNKRTIENAKTFRMERSKERNMKVMYITGGAGSGKTTLAKYLATCEGLDYFVTGSGKDPLDGYDGEGCIIIDDLRADVFTKAELFKFLDNNTNSSVKSRYRNKDISYCELIIITSVKCPSELYNWNEEGNEPAEQLARRLKYNCVLMPDKSNDFVQVVKMDSNLHPLTYENSPLTLDLIFKAMGVVKRATDTFETLLDNCAKMAVKQAKEREMKNDLN